MNVTIGSAPDSFGIWFADDPRQMSGSQFLDEVAEAGYRTIELGPYGYLPTDALRLRGELERRGLNIIAGTAIYNLEEPSAWPELERQVTGAGELVAKLGGKYLVLIDDCYTDLFTGRALQPASLEEPAWRELIKTSQRVGDITRRRFGLTTVFHPHAQTHVENEPQIEALLAQTDPALVSLCLDTGHHAYCGGDPVAFMRVHHPRIPYLHIKSVDRDLQKKVEAEHMPFAHAVEMGIFCEPSKGAVDFPAFRDVLREVGFSGWAVVEQDMYPVPFDKPLPIAKRTRAYLQSIGLG